MAFEGIFSLNRLVFHRPAKIIYRWALGGRLPWSQNNVILLVGQGIFVDDFSRAYFLRNSLRKCIAGRLLAEVIQVPAKPTEIPVVHNIP
jgi:hypothetical protein